MALASARAGAAAFRPLPMDRARVCCGVPWRFWVGGGPNQSGADCSAPWPPQQQSPLLAAGWSSAHVQSVLISLLPLGLPPATPSSSSSDNSSSSCSGRSIACNSLVCSSGIVSKKLISSGNLGPILIAVKRQPESFRKVLSSPWPWRPARPSPRYEWVLCGPKVGPAV